MKKRKIVSVLLCCFLLCCATGSAVALTGDPESRVAAYQSVECVYVGAPKMSGDNVSITMDFSAKIADKQYADMEQRTLFAFKTYLPAGFKLTDGEIDTLYNGGLITTDQPNSLLYGIQFGCPEYNNSRNATGGGLLKVADSVDDIKLYTIEQIQLKAPSVSIFSVQIHYVLNSIQLFLKGGDPNTTWNIAPKLDQEMILRLKAGLVFPTGVMLQEDVTFKFYPELNQWKDVTYGEFLPIDFLDDTLSNQAGYTEKEIELMEKE